MTGLDRLLVAVALGATLANGYGVPGRFEPGIDTHKLWLATGIVLMGASLRLGTLSDAGGPVLAVIGIVTALTILVVEGLSRSVGLADRLGSLLAVGAGICGVSAVVAVAGAVRAREDQIAYAAATVLLFDAATIVVYPVVGELLGLSDAVFGTWAGVSMFSTGPVVAVGFARSELAGQWATIAKLSRNALIGLLVVVYATYYSRGGTAGEAGSLRTLWAEFPKFVPGFVALAAVASTGVLSPEHLTAIEHGYNWLFLVAFVGLGTEIRLDDLREAGPRPVAVVLVALFVASGLSLALLAVLFRDGMPGP